VISAVGVRSGSIGLLGIGYKSLPGLLADCDCVFGNCSLRGGIRLKSLRGLNGLLRLHMRVSCLDRLYRAGHGELPHALNIGRRENTFSPLYHCEKKVVKN